MKSLFTSTSRCCLAGLFFTLGGCQAPQRPALPDQLRLIPVRAEAVTQELEIPVSQDPQAKGKIRVLFKGVKQPDFGIQKVHGNVTDLKLYLVPGNSGTQTPSFSKLIPKTAQNQAVTFTGVSGGTYYVAASAYQNTTNITDTNGTNHIQVNDSGLKHAFVSSSGGEVGFPGRVTVSNDGNYTVTGTPMVTITLTLVVGP